MREHLAETECSAKADLAKRGPCREVSRIDFAGVAQLVEHLVANEDVEGSSPFTCSNSVTRGGYVLNQDS
jgi:hypothetical protein